MVVLRRFLPMVLGVSMGSRRDHEFPSMHHFVKSERVRKMIMGLMILILMIMMMRMRNMMILHFFAAQ